MDLDFRKIGDARLYLDVSSHDGGLLRSALSSARHLCRRSKALYSELQHPFTPGEAIGRSLAPTRCQTLGLVSVLE
jgi:hypothetical protein